MCPWIFIRFSTRIEPMFVSILGIDPGLTRCGFGVVTRSDNRNISFSRVGIFTTSPQDHVSARLAEMHKDIFELIEEIKPDEIALERVLFQKNVSTAMSVAQVSGLVHAIAASKSIPVTEYSPNEVKSAITGNGAADKVAVQSMVTTLLGLTKVPQPADAADALAIAMTHAVAMAGAKAGKKGDTSDNATYNGSNLHNAIADSILSTTKKIPKKKLERENPLKEITRRRTGLSR